MPSIGLKALPLKECISLRIHFFSLNIENIMFPYHMVEDFNKIKSSGEAKLVKGWHEGGEKNKSLLCNFF